MAVEMAEDLSEVSRPTAGARAGTMQRIRLAAAALVVRLAIHLVQGRRALWAGAGVAEGTITAR